MPDQPDAPAPLDEVGTWNLADALAATDFGAEYAKLATADTPAAPDDQPTSEPSGLAKPVEDAEEPKADEARTYTKEEVESRRATAQRERDQARQEAEKLRADAEARAKALEENEFQRGVQLRTLQILEILNMQKGATDLQDLRQAQMQAYQEMQAARSQIVEADIQRVQSETLQEQRTREQMEAANAKAEALFAKRAMGLHREMVSAGVPTFDTETALMDVINSEKYQKQIGRIALLPASEQYAASIDLYEAMEDVVRAKGMQLAQTRQPAARQAAAPPESAVHIPDRQPAQGFDLTSALENTFSAENFLATVAANPHLQGR